MANPVIDQLRMQFRSGSMHIRLILINLFVFVGIRLALAIGNLSHHPEVKQIVDEIFSLRTSFGSFLYQPWALVTSIFSHYNFLHFLLNMLFLYFAGNMFLQFFSGRRLLHVYIIGGIVGGLCEMMVNSVFPQFEHFDLVIVGASGSIMAIFIAIAAYRPTLRLQILPGIQTPLILIAGIYVISDLISIGSKDGTAHFAHIGGALVGFLSVTNLNSSYNIINMSETFGQRWKKFWANLFKPGTRMKVEKGGRMGKTDEQYNLDKKARQAKTDKILDKISKSGYESLTKAEKEFLFSQSKND